MSGFVDEAQIHVKAGDGGAGAVAMRREAHVDKGGPDGGDGGRGGNVWLVATTNQSSLLPFRDHPHRGADNGGHGGGKKMHGKRGGDLEVPVPVGTRARKADGTILCDLVNAGDRWLAGEGGRGGRGNASFLSNNRRAPDVRRAGGEGPRGVVQPRAGPGGRRGTRGVSQCGQVDPHLADLGGEAEDRRLPVHDARAPPGCGADGRREDVHRGRHPRPGRGRGRGQRARSPVPPPHHPRPRPGGARRAGPGDRGDSGGAAPRPHRRIGALPTGPVGAAPPRGGIQGGHGRTGRPAGDVHAGDVRPRRRTDRRGRIPPRPGDLVDHRAGHPRTGRSTGHPRRPGPHRRAGVRRDDRDPPPAARGLLRGAGRRAASSRWWARSPSGPWPSTT